MHLAGVFFYYVTLKRGETSETLAVMGGFSPVATAGIGFALLLFFSEKLPLKTLLPSILLAAGLLGLVNVLEKIVYDQTNFVSGYVWFTTGTFALPLRFLPGLHGENRYFPKLHTITREIGSGIS